MKSLRAVVVFVAVYVPSDAGHHSEEWTWKQEGKDTKFHYEMTRQ